MSVNLRTIKFAVSVVLGALGIGVIANAFVTPYAFTTINGFYQLVLGAVLIWIALTVALAKGQHSSDTAVLQDERPPTEQERTGREAINMTLATGSATSGRIHSAPHGHRVQEPSDDERSEEQVRGP